MTFPPFLVGQKLIGDMLCLDLETGSLWDTKKKKKKKKKDRNEGSDKHTPKSGRKRKDNQQTWHGTESLYKKGNLSNIKSQTRNGIEYNREFITTHAHKESCTCVTTTCVAASFC